MPVWLTRESEVGGVGTRIRPGGTEQALTNAKAKNNNFIRMGFWLAIIQQSPEEKSIAEQVY
jgi:hypothetical protein